MERAALTAVRRFTFNAAADCWPGWSFPAPPADARNLVGALELSRRSARLVQLLGLGGLQRGTASWLSGAFELALGMLEVASSSFSVARQHYTEADAPGLALLMEGYLAIMRQLADDPSQADQADFDQVCARIAAGGFKDGPAWIQQLRTASKVFIRWRVPEVRIQGQRG